MVVSCMPEHVKRSETEDAAGLIIRCILTPPSSILFIESKYRERAIPNKGDDDSWDSHSFTLFLLIEMELKDTVSSSVFFIS